MKSSKNLSCSCRFWDPNYHIWINTLLQKPGSWAYYSLQSSLPTFQTHTAPPEVKACKACDILTCLLFAFIQTIFKTSPTAKMLILSLQSLSLWIQTATHYWNRLFKMGEKKRKILVTYEFYLSLKFQSTKIFLPSSCLENISKYILIFASKI